MSRTPGYVLLSRDIMDKSVWDGDPQVLKLWLYLILRSNFGHKTYVHKGVEVPRGHLVKSYRTIAQDCAFVVQNKRYEWSPAKVERMLDILVRDGRIHITHHGNAGTLIEVLNYSDRQSGDSYRKNTTAKPKVTKKGTDPVKSKELWDIWLSVLSPSPPHPKLTPKRARVLMALYTEQLSKNGSDPLVLFKSVVTAIKKSEWHSKRREWQYPESTFSTEERREQWTHRALTGTKADQHTSTVSRDWSVDK